MKNIFILTITILLQVSFIEINAGPLKWSEEEYSLYAKDDYLSSILTDLAASQGIPVEINPTITQIVSANIVNSTRGKIFESITKAYGLSTYYDGHVLYIDTLENNKSATIVLRNTKPKEFKSQLIKLGVYQEDPHLHWRAVDEKRIIYVSGPAPFVDKIQKLSQKIEMSYAGSDIVYKWKDKNGITNYSTEYSEVPSDAQLLELPRQEKVKVGISLSAPSL